jgi:hypothetical protein
MICFSLPNWSDLTLHVKSGKSKQIVELPQHNLHQHLRLPVRIHFAWSVFWLLSAPRQYRIAPHCGVLTTLPWQLQRERSRESCGLGLMAGTSFARPNYRCQGSHICLTNRHCVIEQSYERTSLSRSVRRAICDSDSSITSRSCQQCSEIEAFSIHSSAMSPDLP